MAGAGEGMELRDLAHIASGNVRRHKPFGNGLAVFTNIRLFCDPVIPFPIIDPREMRASVHTEICTRLFITDLFKIAPNSKQTTCSSTKEQDLSDVLMQGRTVYPQKKK